MSEPKIIEINGPVVKADGMQNSFIGEQVLVGEFKLLGEVIKLYQDIGIIQVYEDTTGLKIDMPIFRENKPLSVELGPGLVGNIFDGLQRPLREFAQQNYVIERTSQQIHPLNREKKWLFIPCAQEGQDADALTIVGKVQETPLVEHRIMVPPLMRGKIIYIAPQGEYTIEETICILKDTDNKEYHLKMFHTWPIRISRPTLGFIKSTEALITGQRVLDFFFPIVKGGTAIIPGGFGAGKTILQHQLSKWSDADIIVYIGCGERGNEMIQVLEEFPRLKDPKSGHPLIERTILIANTSNMPVTAREASIYTGITIAEYFRDMGYNVGLMADSTSRWAEALREISGRLEELPAEEGFPSYLGHRLAEFYERAGKKKITPQREGSISVIGAVSPPGGDFSEPVTVHSKRFVKVFWALDKELSALRHFPAVNWIQSFSEYLEEVKEWWDSQDKKLNWSQLRKEAMNILKEEENLQKVARLIGPQALPDPQRLILFIGKMIKEAFLQQNAFDSVDSFCSPLKQLNLMDVILYFYKKAKEIIKHRIPISKLEELEVVSLIFRAKSIIKNDDLQKFDKLREKINSQLEMLLKEYE